MQKTTKKKIIVDSADEYLLQQFVWTVKEPPISSPHTAYAVAWICGRLMRLHRLILNAKPGECVDHINGNGLDNRRSNLRIATRSQNMRNARSLRGISKYKGVCTHKSTTRWRAYISVSRKQMHLGFFDNEIDAAKAYNAAALKHFGEFARLNNVDT